VKLTKYLGKGALAGRLLVLDEPSTGLHPRDVAGLLVVLDRLVRQGATVVVVEHNLDIIRAADWVIDLGPGAGPQGGRLLYAGPPEGLAACRESLTGQALESEEQVRPNTAPAGAAERGPTVIAIREARANNLKHVSVDFPKAALSVVTGISGSGKSSLVGDVLEAEARRRYLESLSMYERQGVREGPEAPVGSVSGLGVTVRLGTERGLYERRASVGTASELAHHLAVLLAFLGERDCPTCGAQMQRVRRDTSGRWRCPNCHATLPAGEPRHFMPSSYSGACRTCHGVGSLQVPAPHKLIIHPEKPLCAGAMYSPGFFPKGYLGKPGNGGYDMVMALAQRYGFDPFTTPWNQMDFAAQQAFLFGDAEPLPVHFVSKSGRAHTSIHKFPGFYGWVGEWDSGGTYTDTRACPDCGGSRLRPEFRDVRLGGHTTQQLNTIPLAELKDVLDRLASARPGDRSTAELGSGSLETARRRLHFVCRVGLGYLNLDRPAATLSAGEAQRIRLAGLLGSQLTALTVLLDEPTRGLHPSEVEALLEALRQLCAEGNTVIVVEHEAAFMRAADFLVDMGPGAGAQGGQVVSQGTPREVMQGNGLTAGWLTGARRSQAYRRTRRSPQHGWLSISGARGNNLRGEAVRFPLGLLVGVCGVSGSGKSTLVMDTLGRALAPQKQTTSVAREPLEPAPFEAIEGAPRRVVLVDQTRAGMSSPADFLNLSRPLVQLFAAGPAARATGLSAENLLQRCSACGGKGAQQIDMGFLPPVSVACETCRGTGFLPEAWSAVLQDVALPEIFNRTITEVLAFLGALPGGLPVPERLVHALDMAQAVGLGYLGLNQPGFSLSGGEAQRLKIAAELITQKAASKNSEPCLYILDEPTIGQHLEDVERLASVLHRLVDDGHTVLVVEHHPHLLAACDWLVELGPGGGPHGGQVIAAGAPEQVARGDTPIAPYLREILEPPRKDS
jgi:excinuclease ABC subunit A